LLELSNRFGQIQIPVRPEATSSRDQRASRRETLPAYHVWPREIEPCRTGTVKPPPCGLGDIIREKSLSDQKAITFESSGNSSCNKMTVRLETGLNIKPAITHRFHYSEFERGFEVMMTGESGKVIMNWR
jgi:hypothetical protein